MRINEDTLLEECGELINCIEEDSVKNLKKKAEERFGACWALTFRQFFACSAGDFTPVGFDVTKPLEVTVLQFFWMKRFQDFVEEFTKTVEQLTAPTSNEARRASKSCLPMTFEEGVLISCREYFGLNSFEAVYDIKVSDFIIMKKDLYNKAIFERAVQSINESKYKK